MGFYLLFLCFLSISSIQALTTLYKHDLLLSSQQLYVRHCLHHCFFF